MDALLNLMKLQGSLSQNGRAAVKLGTISGYDPANYLAKVLIYPSDDVPATAPFESGWVPVFTPWVGNGWGMFCPPQVGDLVEVHFQEGSLQTAYVGLRTFNDEDRPLNVPPGEFWLVHRTGSFIKLTNDGNVEIMANQDCNINAVNATITTTGNTTVNSTGPIDLNSSEVNLGNGTLSAILNEAARTIYNSHIHIDSTGHNTQTPTQQMDSTTLTTNVKAS